MSATDERARVLYRSLGFSDADRPPVTVRGTVQIRTVPLEIDDVWLTWEKRFVVTD